MEKNFIAKLSKGENQRDLPSLVCTNTLLYAPASFLALYSQMAEAYNNKNTSNAVMLAQQGVAIWEKVYSIYSNETVLVDRRFLDSISSMYTVKAESCMSHKQFDDALYGFDQATKLNPFNTITNDAFMVAAAQLASNDSIVNDMFFSYRNKTDAERYAFGNLLAMMGYLLPYKIGRDDKGMQFYTSIDIVKTLHLTNAVQYPFMIRFRDAGAENLIVVPRWIGLNQYEPLHLDSVAYEKQRTEFELSHLHNDQTNSVNADPAKR